MGTGSGCPVPATQAHILQQPSTTCLERLLSLHAVEYAIRHSCLPTQPTSASIRTFPGAACASRTVCNAWRARLVGAHHVPVPSTHYAYTSTCRHHARGRRCNTQVPCHVFTGDPAATKVTT